MAFTVTKTWTTGEGVTSANLNQNFTDIEDVFSGTTGTKTTINLLGSDTTGGNTTSSSYTQIGSTISVPANAVDDHVFIVVRVRSRTQVQSPSSGSTPNVVDSLKIVIDSTDQLIISPINKMDGFVVSSTNTWTDTEIDGQLVWFHYSPSAGEKSSGFDVKIYGKVVITNAAGNTAGQIYNQTTYVYGG